MHNPENKREQNLSFLAQYQPPTIRNPIPEQKLKDGFHDFDVSGVAIRDQVDKFPLCRHAFDADLLAALRLLNKDFKKHAALLEQAAQLAKLQQPHANSFSILAKLNTSTNDEEAINHILLTCISANLVNLFSAILDKVATNSSYSPDQFASLYDAACYYGREDFIVRLTNKNIPLRPANPHYTCALEYAFEKGLSDATITTLWNAIPKDNKLSYFLRMQKILNGWAYVDRYTRLCKVDGSNCNFEYREIKWEQPPNNYAHLTENIDQQSYDTVLLCMEEANKAHDVVGLCRWRDVLVRRFSDTHILTKALFGKSPTTFQFAAMAMPSPYAVVCEAYPNHREMDEACNKAWHESHQLKLCRFLLTLPNSTGLEIFFDTRNQPFVASPYQLDMLLEAAEIILWDGGRRKESTPSRLQTIEYLGKLGVNVNSLLEKKSNEPLIKSMHQVLISDLIIPYLFSKDDTSEWVKNFKQAYPVHFPRKREGEEKFDEEIYKLHKFIDTIDKQKDRCNTPLQTLPATARYAFYLFQLLSIAGAIYTSIHLPDISDDIESLADQIRIENCTGYNIKGLDPLDSYCTFPGNQTLINEVCSSLCSSLNSAANDAESYIILIIFLVFIPVSAACAITVKTTCDANSFLSSKAKRILAKDTLNLLQDTHITVGDDDTVADVKSRVEARLGKMQELIDQAGGNAFYLDMTSHDFKLSADDSDSSSEENTSNSDEKMPLLGKAAPEHSSTMWAQPADDKSTREVDTSRLRPDTA